MSSKTKALKINVKMRIEIVINFLVVKIFEFLTIIIDTENIVDVEIKIPRYPKIKL